MAEGPVLVALYIEDQEFQAALPTVFGPLVSERFVNSEVGFRTFVEWAAPFRGDSPIHWCATVPAGEGGFVYDWLYQNTEDLFLQNPTRLKEFAQSKGLPWQSAVTLYQLQTSKSDAGPRLTLRSTRTSASVP